jgi:hypothetical protein
MAQDEPGISEEARGGHVRAAGVAIVLAIVLLVFLGPRLLRKFEEPPVVDVSDILMGDVESDIVMVRGIVQRERGEQGYIFLADVEEENEIIVDGISMLPVVRVQTWGWFYTDQQVRLPVRIDEDSAGNLLLVEVRRRGGGERRVSGDRSGPSDADTSAGADTSQSSE